MRYYKIEFQNQNGQPFTPQSVNALGSGITSLDPQGNHNAAALNIELNIAQYTGANAGDINSWLKIYGLPLRDIARGHDYNGSNIVISGGMSKGLPLANPAQRGPLIKGQVFQSFGNWIGTMMSLDMFIAPGFITQGNAISPQGKIDQPVNWTFTYKQGQKLSDALSELFGKTMPGVTAKIQVDDSRSNTGADMSGQYATVPQFAQWLRYHTKGKFGADDDGCAMTFDGNTVTVFETSPSKAQPPQTKSIVAADLIGQPMYYAFNTITAKVVMRGDLDVGMAIKMPKDFVSTVALTPAFYNDLGVQRSADSVNFGGGTYIIQRLQHFGQFRQADASSWVTQIWATFLSQ